MRLNRTSNQLRKTLGAREHGSDVTIERKDQWPEGVAILMVAVAMLVIKADPRWFGLDRSDKPLFFLLGLVLGLPSAIYISMLRVREKRKNEAAAPSPQTQGFASGASSGPFRYQASVLILWIVTAAVVVAVVSIAIPTIMCAAPAV